jgi:L-alanine-DL-glutamate epimerase-like enolase superfamily enzyme
MFDYVPWKDEMIGGPLNIKNGVVDIPDGPGWGVNIDTDVLLKHEWKKGKGPGYTNRKTS